MVQYHPHVPGRERHPDHRGRARRGRAPAQRRRRALHGEIRAQQDGARLARRRLARRADRDQRGPRRRPERRRLYLDITVVPRKRTLEALREIVNIGRDFAGVDITREPIMIRPGQHYIMGGVKTDVDGRTPIDGPVRRRRGRVRLGPRRQPARRQLAARHADLRPPLGRARRRARAPDAACRASTRTHSCSTTPRDDRRDHRRARASGRRVSEIKDELGETMNQYVAVFRDEAGLQAALEIDRAASRRRPRTRTIDDRGTVFNQDVLGAIELGYMLDCAEATVVAALERKESRGAQFRTDYPERNDERVAQAHRHHARQRRRRAADQLLAGHDHPVAARGEEILMAEAYDRRRSSSRSGCAATTPSPARPPYWDEHTVELEPHRSVLEGDPAGARRASTARSASAAPAARRSAARAGCGSTANPALACHTHLGRRASSAPRTA